jgi:hypothetical protein
MKNFRLLLPLLLLMSAALACEMSEVQDAVETVSKTVVLLEEINESGTWKYTTEGIEALGKSNGFVAEAIITSGTTTPTGETITSTNREIRWAMTTDADGDSTLRITQGNEVREYLGVGDKSYRVENGSYSCLDNADQDDLFAGDVSTLFIQYSANAAGVQVISVAEQENAAESMNGFTTTKYRLVSKLQEALDILRDLESDDLRKEIEGVPPFYIDGALYIDNATNALIRFEGHYADLERQEGNTFIFNVTQMGNIPDIIAPDPSKITKQCP